MPEPMGLREAVQLLLEKELRYWSRMYGMEDRGRGDDPYRLELSPPFMARAV
jgi:hypothetical protein